MREWIANYHNFPRFMIQMPNFQAWFSRLGGVEGPFVKKFCSADLLTNSMQCGTWMSGVKKVKVQAIKNIRNISIWNCICRPFDFSNVTIFPNETTISVGIEIMMGIIPSDVSQKLKLFHRGWVMTKGYKDIQTFSLTLVLFKTL